MIKIISAADKTQLDDLLISLRERSVGVDAALLARVASIIDDVRKRGDAALLEYAERFDAVQQQVSELRIATERISRAAAQVDKQVLAAIRDAIRNVRIFHEHQKEESWVISEPDRFLLGQRIDAIERVGLYVPGGTAAYPSSVIMNVVPAQIAGVDRIVIATPPGTVERNPAVAAALVELGTTEVYAIGGAQGVAALAYGTETVPRVDKITGPGNKYVAAAKKLVFGDVGIDAIAGPTEVVVVADESARAEFVAADLLAQAEHGVDASSLLLTTSKTLAENVRSEVEKQTLSLPRKAIVAEALSNYGAIVVFADLAEACELVNGLAPEHVEIMTRDNDGTAKLVRHAGAIFFGAYSPEALGDYFAGPNHVLPTGRTARFSSALGVYDFLKRTSFVSYAPGKLSEESAKIAAFAKAEGLDAHARSILIRSTRALEDER